MSKGCRKFAWLLWPVLFAAAAVATLNIDLSIAQTLRKWKLSWPEYRAYIGYLDMFEPFGHGLGVVLVVLMIHQLDRRRRRALLRLVVCTLAAGGAANLLKLCLMRVRPHSLDLDVAGSACATFGRWFPLLGAGSEGQSFPSGHTATAAALAATLIFFYPQGRLLFIGLAGLVACQRVFSGAHYPSDVLAGAAIGTLLAPLFLSVGVLPKWFDRWEQPSGVSPIATGTSARSE